MTLYALKYKNGKFLGFDSNGRPIETTNVNKIHLWENFGDLSRYQRYLNKDFIVCDVVIGELNTR